MGLTSLVFLLGFVTGCVLAFVRHPIYGLMTYVAVFYLHPPSRWWGSSMPDLRWSLIAAIVTLLALLIARKKSQALPLFRHKIMLGLVVFVLWLAVQSLWALDSSLHLDFLTLAAKYTLLVGLIYKCVDSEKHLRYFLWTHTLGCLYLGWIAFTSYLGGRMEGFGGPGIDESNTGALQIVTGIFVASSLFLVGNLRDRAVLFGAMPFIVNALVTTISRSAFIAAACGGIVFNLFSPPRARRRVRILSILALVLFVLLSNPLYWMRIGSIQYTGEEIEGVDTGAGRRVLMEAQWRMFLQHPLGCGHRCTAILSPRFLDDRYLTGPEENRARSSHNTFLTMLVEHGIPGAMLYGMLAVWVLRSIGKLGRRYRGEEGFLPALVPAIAAILVAIFTGDMFVDYLKFEARVWFIAILMVTLNLAASTVKVPSVGADEVRAPPAPRHGAESSARGAHHGSVRS